MKICLEYIWIDGNNTTRSKNRIIEYSNNELNLMDIPLWNFDGSSTYQQNKNTTKSDIILKPIRIYRDPFIRFIESYLILCECYNINCELLVPHPTNNRSKCEEISLQYKNEECLFGIEQEYTLFELSGLEKSGLEKSGLEKSGLEKSDLPYQWNNNTDPGIGKQGPYYCSNGGDRAFGRPIVNKHLEFCLYAGIDICGTNAEVMASQWEYQIGICDALKVSDDLWVSRYILQRITEDYKCYATFHPKPYEGWNGTGGHTNFSTRTMREEDGWNTIYEACEKLKIKHNEHIKVYGEHNELRLSGQFETSDSKNFSYGVSDRACSIRIPINVYNSKKGYLEDRRPASNLDPYLVTRKLIETICGDVIAVM